MVAVALSVLVLWVVVRPVLRALIAWRTRRQYAALDPHDQLRKFLTGKSEAEAAAAERARRRAAIRQAAPTYCMDRFTVTVSLLLVLVPGLCMLGYQLTYKPTGRVYTYDLAQPVVETSSRPAKAKGPYPVRTPQPRFEGVPVDLPTGAAQL